MHVFYKYNGKFGAVEADFTERKINDAIQWNLLAEEAKYNPKEFIHMTRKVLNEMFEDGDIDYSFKSEETLEEKIKTYVHPKMESGAFDLNITHDNNDHYLMHLGFDNNSYIS